MNSFFTVSELARRHGIAPRHISDLFYARKLNDDGCPVVAGRRLIPESRVAEVESKLREVGVLPAAENAEAICNEGTRAVERDFAAT
jgi:hypothetical protein